jgi:hypothetical protein
MAKWVILSMFSEVAEEVEAELSSLVLESLLMCLLGSSRL